MSDVFGNIMLKQANGDYFLILMSLDRHFSIHEQKQKVFFKEFFFCHFKMIFLFMHKNIQNVTQIDTE